MIELSEKERTWLTGVTMKQLNAMRVHPERFVTLNSSQMQRDIRRVAQMAIAQRKFIKMLQEELRVHQRKA